MKKKHNGTHMLSAEMYPKDCKFWRYNVLAAILCDNPGEVASNIQSGPKSSHFTHNFVKCWSIFKILSLPYSPGNSQ